MEPIETPKSTAIPGPTKPVEQSGHSKIPGYPEHLGTKVQEDDEYWEPEYGRHTFDISEDASEFMLTMTALNDTAVLVADIIGPNGMYFD